MGLFVCAPMMSPANVRLTAIERPIETVERVFERNLWIEDAIENSPAWSRPLAHVLVGSSVPARADAIEAFGEVLAQRGLGRSEVGGETAEPDPALLDGLRARRAFLLADAGRIEEAQGDLDRLTATGHASFVDAVRRATSKVSSNDPRAFDAYEVALAGDEWVGSHLRMRLATAVGDRARAAEFEHAARARTADFTERVNGLTLIKSILLALGLGALLTWLARNRPATMTATAQIPPPWTFESGYAVCVRAAFGAIAVLIVVTSVDKWIGHDVLQTWSGLLVAIPVLWLTRRRLLRPLGLPFASAFGLAELKRPVGWIAFTLALFALEWLGSRVIVDVLHAGGIRSHWSEHVDVIALWSSDTSAFMNAFDGCVFAPIVGELGLRGLLFLTLRRHYGAWQSALFSSLLFGAGQFLSLPALAGVTWQGFVLALAFERTRSLAPSIACSMMSSLLATISTWLFWR